LDKYDKLVKDFFKRIDPSNPLHYYGYKHIVRDEKRREKTVKADGA